MTTRTKSKPTTKSLESLVLADRDSFKALLRESLQEVLEAEMTEALGAAPESGTASCRRPFIQIKTGHPSRRCTVQRAVVYAGTDAIHRSVLVEETAQVTS